jgi:hypothetical protein
MKYLPLVMLIPLVRLIVGDFRRREVSVVWLAVLAVSTVGVPVIMLGWRETFTHSWQNLLLLAYLGIGIVVWGWVKARRFVNPVNVYIGLGDLLFFLALVPLFPVKIFAWLMVCCMVFSLVWWQAAKLRGSAPKNVPLVATSGIVVGVAIIFRVFFL